MSAESIFVYMTLTGLVLIPVALAMTDFSQPINLRPRTARASRPRSRS